MCDYETPGQARIGKLDSTKAFSGRYSLRLDSADYFPAEARGVYNQVSDRSYFYIRTSVRVFLPDTIDKNLLEIVTLFYKNKKANKYLAKGIFSETPPKANQWCYFQSDYLTPEYVLPTDTFATYLWYRGSKKILIDDFRVEIFEPKSKIDYE